MPQRKITLLDGGVGQEINHRASHAESHPQWSVWVMQEEPEIVVRVHKEFIEAGAKVVSLNNYVATPSRMKRYGMFDRYAQTHALAAQCAHDALAELKMKREEVNFIGCLPPLAASYVADLAPPYSQAYDEYCSLIEHQEAFVDVFLVETMSNLVEIRAALDALAHYGQAAYVGLTLKDDDSLTLRSGEALSEALTLLRAQHAEAVMINCSHPEVVGLAIEPLLASSLTFGAYANGFKTIEPLKPGITVDQLEHRVDLTPERYAEHAMSWVERGAKIVGGCCEISPAHIAYLRSELEAAGYVIGKLV